MRKIIASLDIGTDTIKLVVGEMQKNKLNVLSCVEVPSRGIKKGYIVNPESASIAIKECFKKTDELIGIPVKKVIVGVPSYNLECFKTEGTVTITSENKVVTHDDLIKALQKSVYKKIDESKDLVSLLPTKFIINEEEVISNPINAIANKLTVDAVAVVIPRTNVNNIIKCVESLNIEVVDVCVEPLADFYEFKNDSNNGVVGAVVNIGESNTTVSIINKGILTACEVIDMGANSVDNDLAYIYKISKKDARYIKERLAICDIHIASPADSLMFNSVANENDVIKVSQYDASAVVISRVTELFDLIKKQINLLTKKEISYIMFTGGLSELDYFYRLAAEFYGEITTVCNVEEIGARNNKYSVALGMIKYYNSRLKLRNAEFSIFSEEELEEFGAVHKRLNISENSILGKIYGYFFDN